MVLRAVGEGGWRGGQGTDRGGPASCAKGLDLILQERMAIQFLCASDSSATRETRGSASEKKCEVVKYYPITA